MIFIDIVLIVGVLLLAWVSLSGDNLFRSIVLFISLGLLVTIGWARLGAVDVAIAEAAIGAGITGALLLASWRRLRSPETPTNKVADRKPGGVNVQ